ncbi:adhesion G protein-coupled receptor L4-like isoform X2 [Mytilus californianus]|uniref:adhesion G protein-coupled receptor L4-like isoform X2 n=1 Tax=Mytilus californianus TaxID=6549 RepID=UPI00224732E3|nr:adhesion G protein-coupled receptor L4-like isoform X2 [Mytilus californianus]
MVWLGFKLNMWISAMWIRVDLFLSVLGYIYSQAVPNVFVRESSYTVQLGSSITLECDVSSDIQLLSVEWWRRIKNDVFVITSSSNTNKYSGSTISNPSLTVISMTESDQGIYTCVAYSEIGEGKSQDIKLMLKSDLCNGTIYSPALSASLHFKPVANNTMTNSYEICGKDRKPAASALCIKTGKFSSEIRNVIIHNYCFITSIEDTSDKLEEIKRTEINSSNTETVLSQLKNLTATTNHLTADDVITVIEILEDIDQIGSISIKDVTYIVETVDNICKVKTNILQQVQDEYAGTNRILQILDMMVVSLDMKNVTQADIFTDHIIMLVVSVQLTEVPVIGFQLDQSYFALNATTKLSSETDLDVDNLDVAFLLPPDLFSDTNLTKTVVVYIYKDLKLFLTKSHHTNEYTNSRVIAATLKIDGSLINSLDGLNVKTFFKPTTERSDVDCGYWNYSSNSLSGGWSTDGCWLNRTESGRHICLCDHLTNFAIIVNIEGEEHLVDNLLINGLSRLGLLLSIGGLSCNVISFIIFRALRKNNQSIILFNYSLALLCFLVVFVTGISQTDNLHVCVTVSVLLHYFMLVSFMWMFVEGIQLGYGIVKMQTTENISLIKCSLVAWGIPVIPVAVLLAKDYRLYIGGTKACWLSRTAFFYAFLAPVGTILLTNLIVFTCILRRLSIRSPGMSKDDEKRDNRKRIRAAVSSNVLLGLTWIFGFLTIDKASIVFQYIFVFLNVCQGFFIFLIFTLGHRESICNEKKEKSSGKGVSTDKHSSAVSGKTIDTRL